MQKSTFADARRAIRAKRVATSQATAEREVRRRFLAREREHERGIRAYWAALKSKVRVPLRRRAVVKKPDRLKLRLIGQYFLPSYSGPVIDAKGRRGVFMSVEYVGARRSKSGAARRIIAYNTRDDGVERDGAGVPVIVSNIGDTPDEQAAAFELIEVLNRSARGNGKLFFTMIVSLPDDVAVEARQEIIRRFCEEAFGAFDLPYSAALHEPSPQGDQRNHHAHIVFALRPLRRTGDHEWEAGRELLTEHDNPERFFHLRKQFAEIMTEVVQEKGKRREYTHLSNAGRGLKAARQEKLGAIDTSRVRRGEVVPKNERNKARIAEGKADMAADRSRRWAEKGKARQAAMSTVETISLPQPPGVSLPIIGALLPAVPRTSYPVRVASLPAEPAPSSYVRSTALPAAPPIAGSPIRLQTSFPSPPQNSVKVKGVYLPASPVSAGNGVVRPTGHAPTPPKLEPPVRWTRPMPLSADLDPNVDISLWPPMHTLIAAPVKVQAKLPAPPTIAPTVQMSARIVELLERLSGGEKEVEAKRKKKVETSRQQWPPDLGPSR